MDRTADSLVMHAPTVDTRWQCFGLRRGFGLRAVQVLVGGNTCRTYDLMEGAVGVIWCMRAVLVDAMARSECWSLHITRVPITTVRLEMAVWPSNTFQGKTYLRRR
jgi:hypothetical protein